MDAALAGRERCGLREVKPFDSRYAPSEMTDPASTTPTSRCTSCGALFVCGMDDPRGCWCTGLPRLPASALVAGIGCLCEPCLRMLVTPEVGATTTWADPR